MEKQEKLSTELLNQLQDHEDIIHSNEATMRDIVVDLDNVKTDLSIFEEDVKCTATKTKDLSVEVEKEKKKIEAMRADQGKQNWN